MLCWNWDLSYLSRVGYIVALYKSELGRVFAAKFADHFYWAFVSRFLRCLLWVEWSHMVAEGFCAVRVRCFYMPLKIVFAFGLIVAFVAHVEKAVAVVSTPYVTLEIAHFAESGAAAIAGVYLR